ncbi:uncharacterized protein LOC134209084 [Armigeres subalbatus]|uniref:uncharacterized protein LOC134209084 n=1 Tax=Armigeres subalbatus TaxID=124917 RepID=UPI002ED3D3BD
MNENLVKTTGDHSDQFIVKSYTELTFEEKLKVIEENQKRIERELEAEIVLKRKEMEINQAIRRKRLEMEKQMREDQEEHEKIVLEVLLLERKLQLKRMKRRQQSFEESMKRTEKEISCLLWARKRNKYGEKDRKGEGTSESDNHEEFEKVLSFEERKIVKKRKGKSDQNQQRLSQLQLQCMPTKTQLSARSCLCKKLPTFSGKSEEWPLFYGAYQASNKACGYTDVENLVRLQECLKNPALEMVRGQLLFPKSVPKVIEKLRMLYGRPEQILQSHLHKIRHLESPKAGRLTSFIPFGTIIEHLEAAGLKQHLMNPLLVHELVQKLPDNDKRNWESRLIAEAFHIKLMGNDVTVNLQRECGGIDSAYNALVCKIRSLNRRTSTRQRR